MRKKVLFLMTMTILLAGTTIYTYADTDDDESYYEDFDDEDDEDEADESEDDTSAESTGAYYERQGYKLTMNRDGDWFQMEAYLTKTDGSPAEDGWHLMNEWTDDIFGGHYKSWSYVLPGTGGKLLRATWVLDGNDVYYINNYTTVVGSTYKCSETYNPYIGDVIFNTSTNQYEALPYSLKNSNHYISLVFSDKITYAQFLATISGQEYEEWYNANKDWIENRTSVQNNNSSVWNMTDTYIGQALAEKGYSSYEVLEKVKIESAILGGYSAVYKVKVPSSGSYYTGYLRITINSNGTYVNSSF